MISPIFHVVAIVLAVLFIGYVLLTIRRGIFQIRYALVWLFTTIAILVLAIFPDLIVVVARILGVGLGISALFFFGILVCLFILFQHSISISIQAEHHKRLAQELALIRLDLEALKARVLIWFLLSPILC